MFLLEEYEGKGEGVGSTMWYMSTKQIWPAAARGFTSAIANFHSNLGRDLNGLYWGAAKVQGEICYIGCGW